MSTPTEPNNEPEFDPNPIGTLPGEDVHESRGSELSIEQRQVAGLSQGKIVRKRFFGHRAAIVSLIVFGLVVLLAYTSVGVVIGGDGRLVVDPAAGVLVMDGFRIHGWWPKDWWSRYDIVNGRQPTMTLWPLSAGSTPSVRTTWVETCSPARCAVHSSPCWFCSSRASSPRCWAP
ncbi:hypothetical protein KAE78_01015 [Microbacterium sp. NIBRBAC000506063]|nr:hypothetical protein KAE78_01015 [Microbacterium sp. NIBRBAC000506063]